MQFSARLFAGCSTEEAKTERRELLTSHILLLKLIKDVVDEELKSVQTDHLAAGYSDAAWAYKQADVNGALRALTKVRDFLSIKE